MHARERTVLTYAGAALLLVWLVGALGLFHGGEFFHVVLLVGLMLLLLGLLEARDAAAKRSRGVEAGHG
jgi:hypothetical protein